MEDLREYIKNRLRIMGYSREYCWEPLNLEVLAGTKLRLQAFSEFLYLYHVECPSTVDGSMLFEIESDTCDTDQNDFFVNGLPFNVKELTGNISITNNNTADSITFIFIQVNPES